MLVGIFKVVWCLEVNVCKVGLGMVGVLELVVVVRFRGERILCCSRVGMFWLVVFFNVSFSKR